MAGPHSAARLAASSCRDHASAIGCVPVPFGSAPAHDRIMSSVSFPSGDSSEVAVVGKPNDGVMAVGDVNGDGFADAVVGHQMINDSIAYNAVVLLGNHDGTLSIASRLGYPAGVPTTGGATSASGVEASPIALELGDMDNDGDLDVAMSFAGEYPSLWLNDGAGQFEHNRTLSLTVRRDMVLGDFDGDMDLDVFFGDGTAHVPNGTPATPRHTCQMEPLPPRAHVPR